MSPDICSTKYGTMQQIQLVSITPQELKELIVGALQLAGSLTNIPSEKEDTDKLLTRKQAAEVLTISLSTLNTYTKTGIIKGHRIGHRVLYSKKELLLAVHTIKTFI